MDSSATHRPTSGLPSSIAYFQRPLFVTCLFGLLIVTQAVSIVLFGTSNTGSKVSAIVYLSQNLIAIACIRIAHRRSQSVARLFWSLFGIAFLFWLVANITWMCDVFSPQFDVLDTDLRLLYRLAGAPILMMLFLLPSDQTDRLGGEVLLDLLQVGIVVMLTYFVLFYLPTKTMSATDALNHTLRFTNLQNGFLLAATFVRLQFARQPLHRQLLTRLWLFLLVYLIVNLFGNQVELRHDNFITAWFGLCWSLPYLAAAWLALTWRPEKYPLVAQAERPNFLKFLLTNLVLVTLLSCVHGLADRWQAGYSSVFVNAAVAISFLAFTLRLALTQFHQQQEILQRQRAQTELAAANNAVSKLLEDARGQTQEITQISELGSLLQACTSHNDAFRVIEERLHRLFPGTSGHVSMLTPARDRVDVIVHWGSCLPSSRVFAPSDCWCLRRGCVHVISGGASPVRCQNLQSTGPSICVPLIANGETTGTLAVQVDDPPLGLPSDPRGSPRRRQLAIAAAEHIALALSNLTLRESLRVQAVRDPLTGLYNRRHMEEFLEREAYRARRKGRPLAVMMLDLDHFKHYNDSYGHSEGDRVLCLVGEILLGSVRAEDVPCRYGGEEFVILLAECSLQQATDRANQLCRSLRARFRDRPGKIREPVTVSIGVAAYEETTDRVNQLLKCADEALYQAKREGRDRVVTARAVADRVSP